MSVGVLKPGWRRVRFGDVVKLNTDKVADPQGEGLERYVGLEHLEPGDLRVRRWGLVEEGTTFTNYFRPGQVLFGKRRAYQRKVAVADFDGVCSGDIYVFETKDPKVLLPELLPFICQTDAFFDYAVGTSAGSLSPRTNWTSLAKYEFGLPGLEEQHRMLDVLWAAENQHDALGDLNKSAKNLSMALSANLSLISRINESGETVCPLPPGWRVRHIGDLCELGSGYGFRPKDWSERGLPIIRIQNLNGSNDFNYYDKKPQEKWLVHPGELLFAWAGVPGVSFGPCIWSGPLGVLNQHIYRITPKSEISKTWLFHILRLLTPRVERRAHGFKKSLLHIRKSYLTDQFVPVPPKDEQEEITAQLEQGDYTIESTFARFEKHKILKSSLLNQMTRGFDTPKL